MSRSNWWRGGTKVVSFACEPLAGSGVHGPWTLTNNNHLVACFSWCASTERIKLQGSVNKSVRFTSTRRSHVISCVHLQPHWCPGAAMPMLGSLGQPAAPVRTPAARSVRKQAKVPATPTPCTQTTCASTTKTKTKLALLPSPQPVLRSFSVPLSIRTHLDTWGVKLRSKIELVRETWLGSMGVLGFRSLAHRKFRVGTDCSGADAPLWALRATEIPHVHVFSCDNDSAAQALIRSASPPDIFVLRHVDEGGCRSATGGHLCLWLPMYTVQLAALR